ncbi:hypothetical protein C8R46DRAFT_1025895 [Mycena filopes]|nr:hypothetical protein C8R46DRAFT_1025895 [Mycena filopes]
MAFSKDPNKVPIAARKESLRSNPKIPGSMPEPASASSQSSTSSSRATTPDSRILVSRHRERGSSSFGKAPLQAATVVETADEGDPRPQASATYVSERRSPPSGPSAASDAANGGGASNSGDVSFTTSYSELTPGSSAASQPGSPSLLDLNNESVTASLQQRNAFSPEAERFFQGAGRSLQLFKETLSESSNTDEDPLLYYGAVGGDLPGYDSAASLLLREVVMRYQYPHKSFDWGRMSDLIDVVASKDASLVVIMPTANNSAGSRGFALNLADLSLVAQAVVGVQQILSALNAFLLKNPARSFDVDPSFALLYLLEFSDNPIELRFALTSLQLRLQRADVHIRSYLSSICVTTAGDGFSSHLSSTDSTLSDVRDEYGGSHPRKELYRLVARPDYGRCAAIISSYAREQMVQTLGEPPRENYYRSRVHETIPTLKEKGKASAAHAAAPSSAQGSAANAAAPSTSSLGVRFVTPSSPLPSHSRLSAVGSLPGAGAIRDTLSASTAGGPSVTRPISTKGILAVSQTDIATALPPPGQSWMTYAYKTHESGAAPVPEVEKSARLDRANAELPPAWRGMSPAARDPNMGGEDAGLPEETRS